MAERNDLGQAMISLVRDLEPGLLLLVSALSFLICIVMAALPTWLSAAGESLFGPGTRARRRAPNRSQGGSVGVRPAGGGRQVGPRVDVGGRREVDRRGRR